MTITGNAIMLGRSGLTITVTVGNAIMLGRSGLTITVTVETGSAVTASKGSKTVSGVSADGVCVLRVPEAGDWAVTATKDGSTASTTVTVISDYAVTLPYLLASTTPTSGVTYTNGIAGIAPDAMSLYAAAISNNADITNTTSAVYIDDGSLHYKISVGDAINLIVSGASYEFVVVGFNHDDLANGTAYGVSTATGKAGMTLQMRNTLTTSYAMNSTSSTSGGWNGCTLRGTLQGSIKSSMDSAWQSIIKPVNKLASNGGSSIITSEDTLFLLSEIEVFASRTHSYSGEGVQYAWYKAGNPKTKTSSASYGNYWYERSASTYSNIQYCFVGSTGGAAGGQADVGSNFALGVAFAFCI